jgi:trehalose utilization protein
MIGRRPARSGETIPDREAFMSFLPTRRDFLASTTASAALAGLLPTRSESAEPAVKVVVWDERQPAQKQAYENFLGNQVAEHLRSQGYTVTSVGLDDPGQGLTDDVLGGASVLVWWGHVRQGEVAPEVGKKIVAHIKEGELGLIALHSAHWATPFMEAMNERSRADMSKAAQAAGPERPSTIREVPPPRRNTVPKAGDRLTPFVNPRKFPDGRVEAELHLPFCCFPSYRNDGKPSSVRVLIPNHPIVQGLPREFEIPQEEMYDEPFHVPEPDQVFLEERWATGEWFRSGMVWRLGKGRVVYFRPGHETYPTYKQEHPLRVVTNAVRWLASKPS